MGIILKKVLVLVLVKKVFKDFYKREDQQRMTMILIKIFYVEPTRLKHSLKFIG